MRLKARVVIVAGLCLAGTVTTPAMADVFNGRIAFTTNRVDYDPGPGVQRDRDVFSMNPDGSDLRQLTTDPANDAQADWAPNGTAIVYRIRKPNQRVNFEVARMPAGGGERTVLTSSPPGQASSQPSWFPNLRGILFRVSSGAQAEIWSMGPFGERPEPLFTLEGSQWYPSFSPDMRRILFATTLSSRGDSDRGIFTANPDGSGLTLLFDVPGVFDSAPAWSPAGDQIAFESDANLSGGNPEGDREIFVMNADGRGVRQLTSNAVHDEGPAWSPDATMLAYTSGPTNDTGDIHVMTSAGVHLRQLAPYEGIDESPDWQPIPAPATDRRCGDTVGTGARDVRAAGEGLSCDKAHELAARWSATARPGGRPSKVEGFDAEAVDFGGTLRVILTHRGNRDGDTTGNDKLVAFLYQQAATD
jgi:Tol biopolymer transport system component